MEMPPKDNRKNNSAARKRKLFVLYGVPVLLVIVGIVLLTLASLRLVNITIGGSSTQEKPISDVLNMADRHELKSVVLSGNDVLATSTTGKQYHATKEDGQAVTDIFRHDGVVVTIDSGQRMQWAQGAVELVLIALVIGGMVFLIRRGGGMGSQAMPFARSKAKRFNESHPSILFKDVA